MFMNKINLLFVFFALFTLTNTQAQTDADKIGVRVKAILLDYESQNGGDLGAFQSYHSGFEIGLVKHLQERLSLAVPIRFGVVPLPEEVDGFHRTLFSIDARLNYNLTASTAPVVPHLLVGAGYVAEDPGTGNLQIPIGAGLNFRLSDRTYLTWESEYRISLEDGRNNLTHGLGITYFFGDRDKKEEKKEEAMDEEKEEMDENKDELDSDGDGIIDELDLCPNEAGLKNLDGCPDSDEDGIADYKDLCPDKFGTIALKGCPDTDGDGVSDIDDECPNMPGSISNNGCPDDDADSDGIPNDLDRCPTVAGPASNGGCPETDTDGDGTPDNVDECPNAIGPKNTLGCPDQDGDGIKDSNDRCPSIAGTLVNNGCPDSNADSDGDGVPDNVDKCPNQAGSSLYAGCPDTDGDGIDDSRDACPDVPGLASNRGCPAQSIPDPEDLRDIDSDGDGVMDAEDRCPGRPGLAIYDGCPDTDGDGLDDSRDRCPNSAGPVDTQGCPEVSVSDRRVLQIAMRAVQFETADAAFKTESFNVLRQIAQIMEKYPDFDLVIEGHTDNVGDARKNQQLSEQRAKACYTFLINSGVPESRMSYAGFGEARPIANNQTVSGRTLNRRVEFALVPRQ